jgi:hypothetical protein
MLQVGPKVLEGEGRLWGIRNLEVTDHWRMYHDMNSCFA